MDKQATMFEQSEIRGLFEASYHAAGLCVVAYGFGARSLIALITERPSGRYTAEVVGRDLWRMSRDEFRTYSVSGWVAQQVLEAIQRKEQLHAKDLLCYFRTPKPNFIYKSDFEWSIGAKHSMIDSALRHSHAIINSKWEQIAAIGIHLVKNDNLDGGVLANLLG
jgi:hypothetical protein